MNNTLLYIIWGILYVVCGALGVFRAPEWAGILGCIGFFVPPSLLLWQAKNRADRKTLQTVRNLSLIWLGTTLFLLILNILSVSMSATAGTVLYYILVVVSSPMVCGQNWIIAMFLWAYILMSSLRMLKQMK